MATQVEFGSRGKCLYSLFHFNVIGNVHVSNDLPFSHNVSHSKSLREYLEDPLCKQRTFLVRIIFFYGGTCLTVPFEFQAHAGFMFCFGGFGRVYFSIWLLKLNCTVQTRFWTYAFFVHE